ncbi:amidohydrolase family protein [Brevundimonas sp. Root1279]|uniref:amidohydrolase family protein n=1 Tax=Brevundimonas sp. Root1279 TaxID=1736443 RepID=UPI0006F65377|nr:amidohydrolase family protein [Brevundimonas sp. Root1279]KQW79788.1 twin-arginine translocation pathway signal protein [Brevundimonas sp. Root1279]
MCVACRPALGAFLSAAASRRSFLRYAAMGTAVAALPGCGASRGGRDTAEVIFRGGQVLTMSEATPRAEALAVAGGKIIAVGGLDEVNARIGPETRIIDLEGRTLMPGLIDPHMHSSFVLFDDWLDVSPLAAPSMDAVFARLREATAMARPGDWVRAQGFDPSITRNGRVPTLAELDAIAADHPLFMSEGNGHVAYANSLALQKAGVGRDTPNPPQSRYVRDAQGGLTGRLEEAGAMSPFARTMPLPSALEMRMRVRRLMDVAASRGCTALHDCGIGVQAGMEDLRMLDAVMGADPPVRYRGMLVSTAMDEWERERLRPGRGDDRFRVEGIKAWADGSNQAFTGYQREPYLGRESRGALNYALPELTEVIRRAHEGGWQVGVHANGDAAIDTTLAAYDAVLRDRPRTDHRHRIEHCSILHPDQIARMKAMGLSPSFLIGHVRWWGKAFKERILGPERARFYDPCASALAGGLRISLHSDWNVTPIGPLRYVEDAVTRRMNEGGGVFFPEERIPVDAALRAVTLDAAWQCKMDVLCGSLEPGKYADLAVLEQDPTTIDPSRISAIPVSQTWLAGEQKYGA